MVELKGECMCIDCGNEADLIIGCEPSGLQESLGPVEGAETIVCEVCGNEANMTLRES